jgi:hypothetical protein
MAEDKNLFETICEKCVADAVHMVEGYVVEHKLAIT